jgi:uncharacterized membrane protein YgdD (TMEM256/DUF423 family)
MDRLRAQGGAQFYKLYPDLMLHDQNSSFRWTAVAALLGLIGVAMGAIAAHALADPKAIAAIEKAAIYQLIHAVVLIMSTLLTGTIVQWSRVFFLIGIVLFCGSIEVKYLLNLQNVTVVAPAGGICLMLGWVLLCVASLRQRRTQ